VDSAEGQRQQTNHAVHGHDDDDGKKDQYGVEQGDALLTVNTRRGVPAIALRWYANRGGIV
jgi:hypothetical protein